MLLVYLSFLVAQEIVILEFCFQIVFHVFIITLKTIIESLEDF